MAASDMSATGRDSKARYDIGALEQRVYGVESAVKDISASIAALGAKLDERSRTPWVTVIAAGGFLLAFMSTIGVLAYRPVEAKLERHQVEIDNYNTRYVQDLKDEVKFLRAAKPAG